MPSRTRTLCSIRGRSRLHCSIIRPDKLPLVRSSIHGSAHGSIAAGSAIRYRCHHSVSHPWEAHGSIAAAVRRVSRTWYSLLSVGRLTAPLRLAYGSPLTSGLTGYIRGDLHGSIGVRYPLCVRVMYPGATPVGKFPWLHCSDVQRAATVGVESTTSVRIFCGSIAASSILGISSYTVQTHPWALPRHHCSRHGH